MIRRIVLLAAVAACVIGAAGTAAWRGHVESVAALLDAQAATARAFLASAVGVRDPTHVLIAVARPGIDVFVVDRISGESYRWLDGRSEPAPPPPEPGLPPPPGARGGRPFAMLGADLAHVPPRHVEAGDLAIDLFPSARAMTLWLAVDVAICLAAIFAVIAIAAVVGSALAHAARRPLRRTTLALEALAAGDFTPQIVEAGESPEIARLARAYNAAAETVARSIEERRAAAAEFQRFLADAGHELRTPLTIVGGYVEILERHLAGGDATALRAVAGMETASARMRALVEKMLLLARLESSPATPREVEVSAVTSDVVEAMRFGFPDREIVVRCDAEARITIDEDDLYEAERNLVENALRYAPESPVELSAVARGGEVVIEVADKGAGIPAGEQAMVFERFYRGHDRAAASGDGSEGSGLGLAIVRRVVERWGGTIALHSDANGTRFVMRFPAHRAGAPV